jgi:DNA-binding NarL/FixJ family response regulator
MIRLLIVDQVRARPGAAATALAQQRDVELVGIVHSVEEALAALRHCDMMLVSATLPSGGALELVKAVVNLDPWVRVLVTNLAESQEASACYIEAGASGWVM